MYILASFLILREGLSPINKMQTVGFLSVLYQIKELLLSVF